MAKIKVTIDRENCIGCGSCEAMCPSNFYMDKDGKASVKKELVAKVTCEQKAVEACPVSVIKIEKA